MIVSDRIRSMSEGTRIRYYLAQVMSEGITNTRRRELLDAVNQILHGRKLVDQIPDLNLDIIYPVRKDNEKEVKPPVVKFEWEGKTYEMELAILDRRDFVGAKPEAAPRPIQSFLTDEEKAELEKHEE